METAMQQKDMAWEGRDYLMFHPKASVINLGCGLDCTGRTCDPRSCKIYDIDLPDVVKVRDRLLPAGEREKNLALDLNDPSWMSAIDSDPADRTVLFAAGVFYYYSRKTDAENMGETDRHIADGPLHLQIVRMEFETE